MQQAFSSQNRSSNENPRALQNSIDFWRSATGMFTKIMRVFLDVIGDLLRAGSRETSRPALIPWTARRRGSHRSPGVKIGWSQISDGSPNRGKSDSVSRNDVQLTIR